ncbi:hypothetical protein [Salinicoccus sp. HZC-1]|uniref:hypothetical protein n=1 Tax=Salinicoccus sp. HZC-1 TaxID=3385497 RepID=UPI00398B4AE2
MSDKVSSHRRFLQKVERDLKRLYEDGEYESYIERFTQYIAHTEPELELIEKYYESRLRANDKEAIVDDALLSMNAGAGNYETHMYYLLVALIELERYFEVIEFSDHLMNENIPQGFRIEVAALRHRAKKALDNKRMVPEVGPEPEVTADTFVNMLHYEKLELVAEWTEEKNGKYLEMIREAITETKNYELITFMLLYLKEFNDDKPIEIEKFDEVTAVIPGNLESLEELDLSRTVLFSVLSEMEERMPEFLESARAMVMSHIIHCYPFTPDIEMDDLIYSYLLILHEMVNLEYEGKAYATDEAMKWIRSIESSIASRN